MILEYTIGQLHLIQLCSACGSPLCFEILTTVVHSETFRPSGQLGSKMAGEVPGKWYNTRLYHYAAAQRSAMAKMQSSSEGMHHELNHITQESRE